MSWFRRKSSEDISRTIVESATKLLAASFESQARVAEKRAETEVERLKLEQDDRQQLREWRAERRAQARDAGRKGAAKKYAKTPECFICDNPGAQFTTGQWEVHQAHGGTAFPRKENGARPSASLAR